VKWAQAPEPSGTHEAHAPRKVDWASCPDWFFCATWQLTFPRNLTHILPAWQAFCAGGDVKTVAQQVMSGQQQQAMAFFQAEYLTDAAISQLTLPHISLLDGITMGGGAGVSMHGHFRVATER
jgi:hypothetical protein